MINFSPSNYCVKVDEDERGIYIYVYICSRFLIKMRTSVLKKNSLINNLKNRKSIHDYSSFYCNFQHFDHFFSFDGREGFLFRIIMIYVHSRYLQNKMEAIIHFTKRSRKIPVRLRHILYWQYTGRTNLITKLWIKRALLSYFKLLISSMEWNPTKKYMTQKIDFGSWEFTPIS